MTLTFPGVLQTCWVPAILRSAPPPELSPSVQLACAVFRLGVEGEPEADSRAQENEGGVPLPAPSS